MPAIEVGRVCIKTAGREAGEKCVVVEIVDEKFVEVVGVSVKNRRCNIQHLEPVDQVLEIKSEDPEEIKKELEALNK
ncbi:MAG: 50S ribosomal protein L14e [Methanobacteriaceae archaeon]|nr:50S ribosomal protein L14e [Methanobacteriaceae archaeon]MDP2837547.1 50S ribosomal protein L14e [Methanobacteriaceae archaeon]MDP3034158.1 50S ribosomal protein L14e [Methanobacteriaceae archaeon]MDP3484168.1 50S ribosomal protein L14e [Methanobacteriaceae archaeon]MDP3624560.1 50S ribosomal protein L14e [Methanobacteriaceae archaeon]